MAVPTNTVQTYDNRVIFEDLANAFNMISPTETPFMMAIGTSEPATSTYHEWPVVALNAVDANNRVAEGQDAPGNDLGTLANRRGNYTQISDKLMVVTQTSGAVNAAADNLQTIANQMVMKLKELKRDMETMVLSNVPALGGASGVARQAAGLPAFIRTNAIMGATGANPTLSANPNGHPLAAAVPGVAVPITENNFNLLIQQCWLQGADPSLCMVDAIRKRIISQTFTGNASRYKDTMDKKVINAIDFYESDFGTITIVPNRFLPLLAVANAQVLLIDPNFVSLSYLDPVQEKPVAETGHNKRRLLWCEYTLKVDNEAAHGIYRDINP